MTKNGPTPKTKTDSESGECTDHLSFLVFVRILVFSLSELEI